MACLGFNAAGPVDIRDIMAVVAHWGQKNTDPDWDGRFDLDGDGDTDIDDVQLAAGAWRHTCLPPDPAEVAPEVDPGEATNLQEATEFLYTGENPIQTGVVSGTIQAQRVAVLRGKVLTRAGEPLSGVTITVLDHPEYGQTLSREDGMFDLVVNGGGVLTVVYRKNGYLPAHRQVDVPWQDYIWLPDVMLSTRDSRVTTVDLTSGEPMEVARGSVVADADGSRQATLFFPQGTQAELVLPDGSTHPVSELNVRLTEYTVGANGPQAMPAPLPPTSGYTYAVELSADEAVAKVNGKDVVFNQPVIFYVDNFLDFPTGTGVPTGYYDNDRGVWVPVEDGRVVEIVAIAGGLAELDTTGDGVVDNGVGLGVSDAERAQLAALYTPGQSLWRVSLTHFSTWDYNWPYGPGPGSVPPRLPPPDTDLPVQDTPATSSNEWGRIEYQNQVLQEAVSLVGTPFGLHYASYRAPGYQAAGRLDIPLSGAEVPATLKEIVLQVRVAGQSSTQRFAPAPNQHTTFTWDGRDGYGRRVQGGQAAQVRIGYVYDAVYQEPAEFARTFGALSGVPVSANRARQEVTLWQEYKTTLHAGWSAPDQGLGGWTLSIHHIYDPVGRTLYLGDGRRRSAAGIVYNVIDTVAGGGGPPDGLGDGGPATAAALGQPTDVAVGPDGSLYIADFDNDRVRRVAPDGAITTVAGGVQTGPTLCDGRPATPARLPRPTGIDVGPGDSLYIALPYASLVCRIGPDGRLTVVAGNGDQGRGPWESDGQPATQVALGFPVDVAVAEDGSIYIADLDRHRVFRVGPDGIITTVAGTGQEGFSGDGGPARQAQLDFTPSGGFTWLPFRTGIDLGPDGSLYIADQGNLRIRRVGPDGIITTVAGNGTSKYVDGNPAIESGLWFPHAVAVGQDGSLYIAVRMRNDVYRVGPDGIITTVAGSFSPCIYTSNPPCGDKGPASKAQFNRPYGIALGHTNNLYIADIFNHRVRMIAPPLPALSAGDLFIPSEDGVLIYQFTPGGRHQRTLHALTGATIYQFGYDSAGQLISVTDGDGNVTSIERDADGKPTAIIGPFGQRTELTLDANGFLASVTNPAGERTTYTYTAGGLLTSVTGPRPGTTYTFTYDDAGRLTRAGDPEGGFITLKRTAIQGGHVVSATTALGRTTVYRVERLPNGDERRVTTFPDGTEMELLISKDGTRTIHLPDGMTITTTEGSDPRFGMLVPLPVSTVYETPGGLTRNETFNRTVVLNDPNDPFSLATLTDTSVRNGRVWTTVYDAATRQFTTTSPEGRQDVTVIDTLGRPVRSQTAGLAPVTFTYDARGRLVTTTAGEGAAARVTNFAYGDDAWVDSITDPLNQTTSMTRDLVGRVTGLTRPDDQVVGFTYDAHGNLTSVTPPGRAADSQGYELRDLHASFTQPDIGAGPDTTAWTWNADRQPDRLDRPDGTAATYAYDAAGRLATITIPAGTYTATYSAATGQLIGLTAPGGPDLAFAYDGSFPTAESWSGALAGTLTRTYDNNLRLASEAVNGSAVGFTYDDDGLLTGAGNLALTRHPDHGLITATALGQVATAHTYNAFGEATALTATSNGTTLFDATYAYDGLGRIVSLMETVDGTTTTFYYVYDAAGRLVEVREDGAVVRTYTYDANGNRTGGPGGAVGTYDGRDRIQSYGGTTYAYDAAGDLVSKTDAAGTTTYDYDALGNLRGVTLPDGTQIGYLIDGDDRRVGKTVNGTLVQAWLYRDGLNPVAELDGAGNVVARFVYGSNGLVPDYMIKGGTIYRVIADHSFSPRLVVDVSTGAVVQRMAYDEFGNVVLDTNPGFQPFGFAGGLYDPGTGLVRFDARDYDPAIGRFTNRDPALYAGGQTNLYVYADNDPVNLVDPQGTGPATRRRRSLPSRFGYREIRRAVSQVESPPAKLSEEELELIIRSGERIHEISVVLVNQMRGRAINNQRLLIRSTEERTEETSFLRELSTSTSEKLGPNLHDVTELLRFAEQALRNTSARDIEELEPVPFNWHKIRGMR